MIFELDFLSYLKSCSLQHVNFVYIICALAQQQL